jgi:hypothetical protein
LTIPVLPAVAAACNTNKIIKLPVVKLTLLPLKEGKNRLKKGLDSCTWVVTRVVTWVVSLPATRSEK